VLQQFSEDLNIVGLSERTQEPYCRALHKFATYLGKWADQATEKQLRKYLIHILDERKHSASKLNIIHQALKQFYTISFRRDWEVLKLARVQQEQKLPIVLSVGKVQIFLKLVSNRQ